MMYFNIIHFESYTGFRLVSKMLTLSDLERLITTDARYLCDC